MKTEQPSLRIIPAKGTALLITVVFAVILFAYTRFLIHDLGTVIINGQDVQREAPHARLIMVLFLTLPALGLITQSLRLLPGSPFDFLEFGPQGFTVGKLFGRRHRRWDEISGFSTGSLSLTKPPITWIRAESERPLRFFVTGYVRIKLFSRTDAQIREIAAWLDRVRDAYLHGDGTMPRPPEAFAGTIIPLTRGKAPMQGRAGGVIERRSRG